MVTGIYCQTCGVSIPHCEPGLTEHVGHSVAITSRPSATEAAPLPPKDSTLTISSLNADRLPVTVQGMLKESIGLSVLDRGLAAFPPDQGGWFAGGKAAHGDPLMESVDALALGVPRITGGRVLYSDGMEGEIHVSSEGVTYVPLGSSPWFGLTDVDRPDPGWDANAIGEPDWGEVAHERYVEVTELRVKLDGKEIAESVGRWDELPEGKG